MPTSRGEPPRIPDPAALAQGHRLLRVARVLELPAWLCGALGLVMFCSEILGSIDEIASDLADIVERPNWLRLGLLLLWSCSDVLGDIDELVLGLALMLALAWLGWERMRAPSMQAPTPRDPRLPDEIHNLLGLVDGLIDTLERGQDRLFKLDVTELGLALDTLGPEACRHLDERGADRARLRHGVCCFDPEAKLSTVLSAELRRALHYELLRFSAAARGRTCGDPYRARMSDGPTLLAMVREPALARTRRRCVGVLLLVVASWAVVSRGMVALQLRASILCVPWAGNPHCEFVPLELERELERFHAGLAHPDPFTGGVVAVAVLPMFLLIAARVAREAAWHSFSAALPDGDELQSARDERVFVRARRRQRAARRLWRALVWLACSFGACVVLLVASDWDWRFFTLTEQIVVLELLTLGLVVIPTLIAKLERTCERRVLRHRIRRAPGSAKLLTELFELRRGLEQAAPVRAELLEQLAAALEQADALGRLSTHDRDRVVARLRAAAARGPALDRRRRDQLALDVRICEASIGSASSLK
jgi:hypothetical protein